MEAIRVIMKKKGTMTPSEHQMLNSSSNYNYEYAETQHDGCVSGKSQILIMYILHYIIL